MMRKITKVGDEVRIIFPYDEGLVSWMRTLPDYGWNPNGKYWHVPATPWHAQYVIRVLTSREFAIDDDVRRLAKQSRRDMIRSDMPVTQKLYPFQIDCFHFIVNTDGRCLIGDDVGLGKTIEALSFCHAQRGIIDNILIIAPANVIYKWQDECTRWLPNSSTEIVDNGKAVMGEADVTIMSYTMMRIRRDELKGMTWDCIIFDECHYLKGRRGRVQRVDAAMEIAMGVPRILCLSATPFLNRPIELWNVLNMLRPDMFPNFWRYATRYCGSKFEGFKEAYNRRELSERLTTVMIRRLKQDVLRDLPSLTRTKIRVDIDRSIYANVEKEIFSTIKQMDPDHKGYFVSMLDKLNALRRVIGKEKVSAALGWIQNYLDSTDRNLVVYVHHLENVERLAQELKKYGCIVISGNVSAAKRARRIERFQNGDVRVAIITSAGGEGIDLFGIGGTIADTILILEREWTPSKETQVEGRLHRIGQEHPVEAIYFIANNTIDSEMNRLIEDKRQILDDIVGEPDVDTRVLKGLVDYIRRK